MVGDFLDENSSQKDCGLLVFTDLDGTLLDHESYSFQPALPALAVLEDNNIPLIVCTSKTRAEIEPVRCQLKNRHPFISENGGAIFIPRGYFSPEPPASREDRDYRVIELGIPYGKLREIFCSMCASLPGKLRGFGDCTPEEVAELCSFSLAEARLAMQREYDEPFVLLKDVPCNVLQGMAHRAHTQVSRGGRFYHLTGNNDKGRAVRILRDFYRSDTGPATVVALGDSLNDLPMLEAADYPVLVRKGDGSCDPAVRPGNLMVTRLSGPAGWCEALLELLPQLGVAC